jgi:hypothetical protein
MIRFEMPWTRMAGARLHKAKMRYCDGMRNITVAVDDETYTRVGVAAAERNTSVSALVKAYLEQLASHETEPSA